MDYRMSRPASETRQFELTTPLFGPSSESSELGRLVDPEGNGLFQFPGRTRR